MADETARRRAALGRGLDALFGDDEVAPAEDSAGVPQRLPVEFLTPNPRQPRRRFDEEELASLAASVREQGILQPIMVRPTAGQANRFEIIAGERRWRAAQLAQLHDVPVVVRELADDDALQIAVIENVQRQDLTPLEEASGYRQLIREFGHTQDDLSRVVGKSRSHIANTLRLLDLPEPVQALLDEGRLTAGHARALLTCPDPAAAAREVVEKGLTVRQAEALARRTAEPEPPAAGTGPTEAPAGPARAPRRRSRDRRGKDPDIRALEEDMTGLLGLQVTIDPQNDQSGAVTIEYKTLEQLDDVLRRLSQGNAAPS